VLGRAFIPVQRGYGQIRPTVVDNGGDPTGLVSAITWQTWGGQQAIGQGISDYVAENQIVAAGSEEPVTIVAFDLGTCRGQAAYLRVEWFYPQHGQGFEPNGMDICNWAQPGVGATAGTTPEGCPIPAHPPDPTVPTCYVTARSVNLRAAPSSSAALLGQIPESVRLSVLCLAQGEPVSGPYGTDTAWEKVTLGSTTGFVADAYVLKYGEYGAPTPPPC
jgi:hypothetical protein